MTRRLVPFLSGAALAWALPALAADWTVRPLPRPEVTPAAVVVPLDQIRPTPRPALPELDAEPVAGNCLDPASVADEDLRAHAAVFAANSKLCVETVGFVENGMDWQFTVITNTARRRGPTLILLHDNENAAFATALYGIQAYGGRILAVEASGMRLFNRVQDPNRNFATSAAAAAPCRDMKIKPAPVFTRFVKDQFDGRYPVITLHNNDDGYSGGGGTGTISARRQSPVMTGLMAPASVGRVSDEDNAVLLAGTAPFGENTDAQRTTAFFHARGINVIYEHVTAARNDCSLSNYVILGNHGDYYNIEAEKGDFASQKVLFEALMEHLKIRRRG